MPFTETVLFIGGDLDGQWLDVDGEMETFNFIRPHAPALRVRSYPALHIQPVRSEYVYYKRRSIFSPAKQFCFFAPESMTYDDCLAMLLKNYIKPTAG